LKAGALPGDRDVWRIAAPMILSNVSVPLLGMVDTGVVGHLENATYLGRLGIDVSDVNDLLAFDYFRQAGYIHWQAIEYVITFFMLLGGINFLLHYKILTGKQSEVRDNIEFRYFIAFILIINSFWNLVLPYW